MVTKKGLKFDPGFASCVARVSGNLEYLYSAFNSIVSLKQKKFQFAIIYPKILKIVDENTAFYLGCMMWAIYLKSNKNTLIINNPCLNTVFDEESLSEIRFLAEFVKTGLNRDSKYYLNKQYIANPVYVKILETYKEFLILNKGFINTENTDDIVIPSSFKKIGASDINKIKELIDETVAKEDITLLLPFGEIVV